MHSKHKDKEGEISNVRVKSLERKTNLRSANARKLSCLKVNQLVGKYNNLKLSRPRLRRIKDSNFSQPMLENLGNAFYQTDLTTLVASHALAMIIQVNAAGPTSSVPPINCVFPKMMPTSILVALVLILLSKRLLVRTFVWVVSLERLTYNDNWTKTIADTKLANDTGAVLPCGDPSLGEFCCDEGQGFACCSTPSKILTLGKGTTFTENSPKPSATSNSNPISQSQRSSQPETTRTETATATQTQTQISSATQTVVQTSVSISVQVITSTQSPTFTTSFSPAASATASTSIILVTQTTSKQTQPSNSLATAPSSSVFQNQNSQPTSSSTISNFNTQASSSINGDQNQNGGSTISSTTSSQASSKAQNQNQTDNRNNQTSLTNLLKSPNMTAIIVGVSVSILVVLVGIAAFYIRKRRRSKKSQVQLRDGIGRESGSDKGTFEKIGKKDRNEDASIGVFVTVSEKFKGFKEKAHNVHAKESDRVSREFDGALGGGMYLEGGTMGRGRRPQNSMYRGDMSTNSNNPPPIPSSFSNPRTPPPPPQLQQSRMSHNSGRSFMSASSGSQYSRATTGESVRIPLQSDMPVPYRTVGSENGGAYRMFSREEERDLDIGLGLGRMDGQPKEEPRGFF